MTNSAHRLTDTRMLFSRNGDTPRQSAPALACYLALLFLGLGSDGNAAESKLTATNLGVAGSLSPEAAQLTITADLLKPDDASVLVYTSEVHETVRINPETVSYESAFQFHRIQGALKQIELGIPEDRSISKVTGKHLLSWAVRQGTERRLELVFAEDAHEAAHLAVTIRSESELEQAPTALPLQGWRLENPVLGTGRVTLQWDGPLKVVVAAKTHLYPVPTDETKNHELRFQFHGTTYTATVQVGLADPDALRAVLHDVKLSGTRTDYQLRFELRAELATKNPAGAELALLQNAAITATELPEGVTLQYRNGSYWLKMAAPGRHPIRITFEGIVQDASPWEFAHFQLPAASLLPVTLHGFDSDTEVHFLEGAALEREQNAYQGYLPATGKASLRWRKRAPEESSKLFYNTESSNRIRIGSGVMRQSVITDVTVLQGEVERLTFAVSGEGEITRVTAPDLLSWKLETDPDNANQKNLNVIFNQPKTGRIQIGVTSVATLPAFPTEATPLSLIPAGATRHHGTIDLVNEGAVRLGIASTAGLSRFSPTSAAKSSAETDPNSPYPVQHFAFRHSSSQYALTIQADVIQPEVTASLLALYHLGQDQTRIEADIELEIREAPLREYTLEVPADFSVAEVASQRLSDYFLTPGDTPNVALLRLVYGQPVFDRHQIRLRLERNQAPAGNVWSLSKLTPLETRQVRGHVGVTSAQGFRLTPDSFNGVTEIATVYFPKQAEGLQTAFRLTDPDWTISINATPIPQAIQADAVHLYTVGNGLIYGSSLIHFEISGSPIDTLQFAVPDSYLNVEFTGDEVRNWSATDAGYDVILQTPRMGFYTLLVTYERPFSDSGDQLASSGVTPLNADTEQGTIILTSNRQIQLTEGDAQSGLIRLTPEELSPEHQLLLSQPILAAYQYPQRPFSLDLSLTTLAEGEAVRQIIDRAQFETRVARDGETITKAHYLIKAGNSPHFALQAPPNVQIWSAEVDGKKVIPINTDQADLIPLPPSNEELRSVVVTFAAPASQASPVTITLPTLSAPLLSAGWKLQAAPNQKLKFVSGNLIPKAGSEPLNGFDHLTGFWKGTRPWTRSTREMAIGILGLLVLTGVLFALAGTGWCRAKGWRAGTLMVFGYLTLIALLCLTGALFVEARDRLPTPAVNLDVPTTLTSPGATPQVVVENRTTGFNVTDGIAYLWPLAIAGFFLLYTWLQTPGPSRRWGELGTWASLILGSLTWPTGGPWAVLFSVAFLVRYLAIPLIRCASRAPVVTATPASVWLALGIASASFIPSGNAAESAPSASPLADRVHQTMRIAKTDATSKVTLHWTAKQGDTLPILKAPGVLTGIEHTPNAIRLIEAPGPNGWQRILALQAGSHEITFTYSIALASEGDASRNQFPLPTHYGLVNQMEVTITEPNHDLVVSGAVSVVPVETETASERSWQVTPPMTHNTEIRWEPQRRNRSEEDVVFFAELTALLIPRSGLIESFQDIAIRPAQGEVTEINVILPPDVTVNEVLANDLSLWRFEPESRRLRIELKEAQHRPFLIRVRSQRVTDTLPYTTTLAFARIEGASNQVGMLGIVTENDTQLVQLEPTGLVPIDPRDFQSELISICQGQFPQSQLRRAFRFAAAEGTLNLTAEEVAPHLAVTTQDRLSIGEDRTLLASVIEARVTRAGIFSLQFHLPDNMTIDSISGEHLSHWTEFTENTQRTVTLHLKEKLMGTLRFNATLTGPGLTTATAWTAPKIAIQEANRQQGRLLVVPEIGIRLQAQTRDNVSQLDPRSLGITTQGALAFNYLNADWALSFSLEQLTPWIEVVALQDAVFSEGKIEVSAWLNLQVKNTAVKEFGIRVPALANNVQFDGEYLADSIASTAPADTHQLWNVRLQRRTLGDYALRVTYQIPRTDNVSLALRGVVVENTSLQRGYLTLRTQGRLQIAATDVPASLYPSDVSNIPRALRSGLPESVAVQQSYRIVNADFELPVTVSRHEVTPVLPAQISTFKLTTVISRSGNTLTQAAISLIPGSKRSLAVTLPTNTQFWFARVNGQAVSAWIQGDQLLIPLTDLFGAEAASQIELYLQTPHTVSETHELDATLSSLLLDLPADAVAWDIYLDEHWELDDWDGDLELVSESWEGKPKVDQIEHYLEQENERRRARTQEAESMLRIGNTHLEEGNENLARFAFNNAYGLTQHDEAFNEDARVQLQNVKTQQAMAGISLQQQRQAEGRQSLSAKLPRGVYSAGAILEQADPANENSLLNLANRLVAQQEEAAPTAERFDISLPTQGTHLQFVKSVQVDSSSNLQLRIQANAPGGTARWPVILTLILGGLFVAWLNQLMVARTQS